LITSAPLNTHVCAPPERLGLNQTKRDDLANEIDVSFGQN